MNNNLRKILSYILVIAAMLSLTNAYADVTDRNEKPEEETYTSETYGYNSGMFLKKIGAIDDIGILESEISRGEFCKVLYETIFPGVAFSQRKRFEDVDENTENSDYINTIAEYGYINGYDDNYFRPENVIAPSEAAAIYIRILGYDIPSNPMTYEQITSQLGLVNGIKFYNKAMTWADCYIITENALKTDVMVYDDNNKSYNKIDETLLEYQLDIYDCKGIVTDNGMTALTHESMVNGNELIIDNQIYSRGNASVDGLLGCYVRGYYKWDENENERTLLYADIDDSRTKYKEFQKPDIDDFTLTEIKYGENGRSKTIKISLDADYIYNGLASGSLTDEIINNFTLGDVKVIDSNNDGTYDVLFINSYKTMVVQSISESDKSIFGKYNDKVKLSSYDDNKIKVYRDDKEISWTELHDFDVIKILENKDSWTAWVINKAYYGSVESIKTKGTETKYVLNGEEYTFSREYEESMAAKPVVDSTGMFYFTDQNQIVYFETGSENTIGYLHKVLSAEEYEGVSDPVLAEILSTDNKWHKLSFADKVKLNGTTVKKENLFNEHLIYANGATVRNPVQYTLNKDGRISKLTVPDPNCPDDDTLQPAFTGKTLHYSGGTGTSLFLESNNGNVPAGFIQKSTIYFKIPENPDDKEYYYATVGFDGTNDKNYEGVSAFYTSYDSKKTRDLNIIVRAESGAVAISDSALRISVVKNIDTAMNDDGEVCDRLTVMRRGKEYSYFAQPGRKINGINPGDVIRLFWDANERVSGYKKIYSIDEDLDYTTVIYSASNVRRDNAEIMEYAKRLWGINNFSQYHESEYYVGDFAANTSLSSPAEAGYYTMNWYDLGYLKGTVTYKSNSLIELKTDYMTFPLKFGTTNSADYYMTGIEIVTKTGGGLDISAGKASDVSIDDKVVVNFERGGILDMIVYKNN